ncbi:MAG: DUF4926 domain-containing protein [Dehalococcoidia bacterium]
MTFDILECIVLTRDLVELGLRQGDLGTVVEVYPPDGLEVEFVAASGETQAVVSLSTQDVRKVSESDILAVRSLTA